MPGLMRKLMDERNDSLNGELNGLMQWLFCEPNPIAINTTLMMTKAVSASFRLPYQALTLQQREQGFALLSKLSQSDLVGDSLELLSDDDFSYSP